MWARMLHSAQCTSLLLLYIILNADGEHVPTESKKEATGRRTNVKISIPSFFNFIPDLDGLFQDFDPETFGVKVNEPKVESSAEEESIKAAPQIKEILQKAKDNYQKVRETLQTTLNSSNPSELFTLDLKSRGSKTKLHINTPLTQISLDAKSPDGIDPGRSGDLPQERTSEVPFRDYLNNLISHHAKRLGDISLSIVSEPAAEGDQSGSKSAPLLPIKVAVSSNSEFMRKTGWEPEGSKADVEDELDPEKEYQQHIEHQKRKYMDMRAKTSLPTTPASGLHSWAAPFSSGQTGFLDILGFQDPLKSLQGAAKNPQAFMQQVFDPIKRMNEFFDSQNSKPKESFKIKDSQGASDEQESYEEYIDDLEGVTGSLTEQARAKLRSAFKQFKKSLDDVNLGENVDVEKLMFMEPKDKSSWLPRRIIDQRDLEIAFLNINKDSRDKIDPNDRVIIAFTLTGVPLKLHIDPSIEQPIKYLHKILTDAGVTLNIPVKSFQDMDPVAAEVLYVGAGNSGTEVTQAMALEVPNVNEIKTTVKRYLKTRSNQSQIGKDNSAAVLNAALHETLTSKKKPNFSEALAESFQRNPVQVLADMVNFLSQSPQVPDPKEDQMQEDPTAIN